MSRFGGRTSGFGAPKIAIRFPIASLKFGEAANFIRRSAGTRSAGDDKLNAVALEEDACTAPEDCVLINF